MKKPSLSVETFLASLLAVASAAGTVGCRSTEHASQEPSTERSGAAPAASAGATAAVAPTGPAAPAVAAAATAATAANERKAEVAAIGVDAGVTTPSKRGASASCGAGSCSADMKKKPH